MKVFLRFLLFVGIFLMSSMRMNTAFGNVQNDDVLTGNDIFDTTIGCEEEQVDIYMDFTNQAMTIPGQDVFGEMAGYIKARYDSRYWMITSAEIDKKGLTATIEVINDYGSEDLTATITYNPKDSTYILRQKEGSVIKFGKNRKWQKLPKEMVFKKPLSPTLTPRGRE